MDEVKKTALRKWTTLFNTIIKIWLTYSLIWHLFERWYFFVSQPVCSNPNFTHLQSKLNLNAKTYDWIFCFMLLCWRFKIIDVIQKGYINSVIQLLVLCHISDVDYVSIDPPFSMSMYERYLLKFFVPLWLS